MSVTTRSASIIGSIALAAGLGLAGAGTANAGAPRATGEVIANGGLSVRYSPSIHTGSVGSVREGQRLTLTCKVRGTKVRGNDIWYNLGRQTRWVSARYVRNIGPAPSWCIGSAAVGQNTEAIALNLRAGPTTQDKVVGALAANGRVDLICKVRGETIRGNNLWYQTSDRKWVTARYVDNVGNAPSYC